MRRAVTFFLASKYQRVRGKPAGFTHPWRQAAASGGPTRGWSRTRQGVREERVCRWRCGAPARFVLLGRRGGIGKWRLHAQIQWGVSCQRRRICAGGWTFGFAVPLLKPSRNIRRWKSVTVRARREPRTRAPRRPVTPAAKPRGDCGGTPCRIHKKRALYRRHCIRATKKPNPGGQPTARGCMLPYAAMQAAVSSSSAGPHLSRMSVGGEATARKEILELRKAGRGGVAPTRSLFHLFPCAVRGRAGSHLEESWERHCRNLRSQELVPGSRARATTLAGTPQPSLPAGGHTPHCRAPTMVPRECRRSKFRTFKVEVAGPWRTETDYTSKRSQSTDAQLASIKLEVRQTLPYLPPPSDPNTHPRSRPPLRARGPGRYCSKIHELIFITAR